jgi:hypothetical protein
MTATCQQVGEIVLRLETPFLDTPGLMLTVEQARRHFGLDAPVCKAVLDTLTDARVLTRTPDGAYTRYFPKGRRLSGLAA